MIDSIQSELDNQLLVIRFKPDNQQVKLEIILNHFLLNQLHTLEYEDIENEVMPILEEWLILKSKKL